MAKFYPIGHVFQHGDVRLMVKSTGDSCVCFECYFSDKSDCPDLCCGSLTRKDKTDAVFVETTDPLTE